MFNETDDQMIHPLFRSLTVISKADGVAGLTPEYKSRRDSTAWNSLPLEWLSFNIHPLDGKSDNDVGARWSSAVFTTPTSSRRFSDAPEMPLPVSTWLQSTVTDYNGDD